MAPEPPDPLTRLDPDAAAPPPGRELPRPVRPERGIVDVRRYRRSVGAIGLAVVIGFSVYGALTRHGAGTGVAAGRRLRWFAAPLAASDLQGVANLHPSCRRAGHDPRALNLCLDARSAPIVLSLFVPGSAACVRQVDALQELSRRYPPGEVRFLAVAIGASHRRTAALVRAHRWRIPVAYDSAGAVGEQYGFVVCPMAELARRGGIVRNRLIGDRWQTSTALAPDVRALLAPAS